MPTIHEATGTARGRSKSEAGTLRKLAKFALLRAGRPAGADPRTIAAGIGIRARPCAEEDAALVGATVDEFRWAWSDDEAARLDRLWRGLAACLLIRVQMKPTPERVDALTDALKKNN